MWNQLCTFIFGKNERRKGRFKISDFFTVRVQIAGQRFVCFNFSPTGFAVKSEEDHGLKVGAQLIAEFMIYGQRKASVQVRVLRIDDAAIAFEVLELKKFKEFSEQYLSMVPKI
jgi:hypothetical protein